MQEIDHDDSGGPCAVVKAEGTALTYEITTVEPQELSGYFRQLCKINDIWGETPLK